MNRNELLTLLEGMKRRYCNAVKKHYKVVARSEKSRMEEVRTKLYALNAEKGINVFNEEFHAS